MRKDIYIYSFTLSVPCKILHVGVHLETIIVVEFKIFYAKSSTMIDNCEPGVT